MTFEKEANAHAALVPNRLHAPLGTLLSDPPLKAPTRSQDDMQVNSEIHLH